MNEIFCLTYNKKSAIIIIAIAINVSKNIKKTRSDTPSLFLC